MHLSAARACWGRPGARCRGWGTHTWSQLPGQRLLNSESDEHYRTWACCTHTDTNIPTIYKIICIQQRYQNAYHHHVCLVPTSVQLLFEYTVEETGTRPRRLLGKHFTVLLAGDEALSPKPPISVQGDERWWLVQVPGSAHTTTNWIGPSADVLSSLW